MGKLIKPLVVVLLIASITALTLGSMLFGKRELLKARTLKLEAGLEKIARSVRVEKFNKNALKVTDKEQLSRIDKPIRDIALAGDLLCEEIENTKTDLATRTTELNSITESLAQKENELVALQQTIKQVEDELSSTRADLSQALPSLEQFRDKENSLQATIDDLNSQLSQADVEKRDLQVHIQTLEESITDLETEMGAEAGKTVPKGLTGFVLAVNSDWNYVVLDIGTKAGLIAETEMLVHRDDKLVGKVHVSDVKSNMAIAEIMNDWQQFPIREGDRVLF